MFKSALSIQIFKTVVVYLRSTLNFLQRAMTWSKFKNVNVIIKLSIKTIQGGKTYLPKEKFNE